MSTTVGLGALGDLAEMCDKSAGDVRSIVETLLAIAARASEMPSALLSDTLDHAPGLVEAAERLHAATGILVKSSRALHGAAKNESRARTRLTFN